MKKGISSLHDKIYVHIHDGNQFTYGSQVAVLTEKEHLEFPRLPTKEYVARDIIHNLITEACSWYGASNSVKIANRVLEKLSKVNENDQR